MAPAHSCRWWCSPIGAGSLFFSHVNDAGFWLVKEYFGLTVGQTIKTWSVMETIISVVALALTCRCRWWSSPSVMKGTLMDVKAMRVPFMALTDVDM